MSRAQFIRKKRLKERQKIKEESKPFKVKTEAEKLFEWVLDLFEEPTEFNTADEVILSANYSGNIVIGYTDKGLTERKFNDEVMKVLEEMCNSEEGYVAKFHQFDYPSLSSIIIRIE